MSPVLRGRRSQPAMGERDVAVTRQVAAVVLQYPDEDLLARLPMLRAATATLPARIRGELGPLLDHLERTPPPRLAVDYVETFDLKRRCCLYLTYYAYGDTRKRGLALLRFTSAYRAAGLTLAPGELPDHLCVVLEFAATADARAGTRLLTDHRAGLEILRLALADAASPYAGAVAAVSATLPPLAGDDHEAVARLAAQGPPAEEVGLEPFAPPEYMPTSTGART